MQDFLTSAGGLTTFLLTNKLALASQSSQPKDDKRWQKMTEGELTTEPHLHEIKQDHIAVLFPIRKNFLLSKKKENNFL